MKFIEIFSNGSTLHIRAVRIDQKIWIHFKGTILTLPYPPISPRANLPQSALMEKDLKKNIISPMPGRVLKIFVKTGDLVKKNQSLLILSAMKIEYTLKAPAVCRIELIKIKLGDLVSVDQELIKINDSIEG